MSQTIHMTRPPLTWPLMLTLAVCVVVFLGVALQLYANTGIVVLFSLASDPWGSLVLAAVAFVLLLSSFTFARILLRRSGWAARLYLMTVFVLSGAVTAFDWYQSEAVNAEALVWLTFIAGLFFLVRPVALRQADGPRT